MGLFDGMNNPWAPGGQMSPRLPWAQPALNYGWGHGNEFFTPKTQEQIRKEALLQLAVLAAVVVAPALVGAAGGAGAAGAEAAGMGASAEAAGAVAGQGAIAAGGGAAVGSGLAASVGAGAGMAAILQPFLQQGSLQALQRAAQMGEAPLNNALHELSQPTQQVEFDHGGGPTYRSSVAMLNPRLQLQFFSSKVDMSKAFLAGLAEEIGKRPSLQKVIQRTTHFNDLDFKTQAEAKELLIDLLTNKLGFLNPWQTSIGSAMSPTNSQDPLKKAIEKGLESSRFKSLWEENGFNLDNYSDKIESGPQTRYYGPPDDLIQIHIRESGYDVLAIAHEMTNRKYKDVFAALDDSVAKGDITFDEYSEGIIAIELNGIQNKIVVAAELEIPYEPVQDLIDYYSVGAIDEEKILEYLTPAVESAIVKDTGLPAKEHYRQMGQQKREKYLEEHGN